MLSFMKYPCPIFFLIAGAVLLWPAFAAADPVDPRNPEKWRVMQAVESQRLPGWLPNRIRQLETERLAVQCGVDVLIWHPILNMRQP